MTDENPLADGPIADTLLQVYVEGAGVGAAQSAYSHMTSNMPWVPKALARRASVLIGQEIANRIVAKLEADPLARDELLRRWWLESVARLQRSGSGGSCSQ